MNIVVIGGGYTGLTAAYELLKSGNSVTLYEKSSELGGLAGGFEIQGESLEKAYHHLFKTDTDIIELIDELGISDKLKWHESSVAIYYDNKIYPFGGASDLLKFRPLSFFSRIRTGLMTLFLQKYKNWRSFEKVAAFNWMKKWNGMESLKVIWEPLLKGKFDKYYDKVSMAWLWARLHIRANSRESLLAKEKLGYIDGGFDEFTKALVSKIKDLGGEIVLNANIESIRSEGESVKLEVESKEYEYDKVIATIPSNIFAKLIENNSVDKNYIDKLESINYLGATVMVFSSEQKLGDYYWYNINDLKKPFLVFINHTNLIDKKRYGGKYVYYIGAYIPHSHDYFSIADEELSNKWFSALKDIFPEFNEDEVVDKFIFRMRNAQHVVDLDYESKIPNYKTPLTNIYLANFSQIFPEDRGTNFAVREGIKIARLVAQKS